MRPIHAAIGLVVLAGLGAGLGIWLGRPEGHCGPLPERGEGPADSDSVCRDVVAVVARAHPSVSTAGIWVQWSDRVETGTVAVAGTIRGERPWPWIERRVVWVSTLDKNGRPWSARESALAHEILFHETSRRLLRGENRDHSDPELARIFAIWERSSL